MNKKAIPPEATLVLRDILKHQYHAALRMLQQAIEPCPEDLWLRQDATNAFWQVAYHALFYTHLYIQPNEAAFCAWRYHRKEYQFLGNLPWPPHDKPKIGEPYTKEEVLAYWSLCDDMINITVDSLDLESPECRFWWYKMSKAEHQMMNIRHIQHHAAQLADRLRAAADVGVGWIGSR